MNYHMISMMVYSLYLNKGVSIVEGSFGLQLCFSYVNVLEIIIMKVAHFLNPEPGKLARADGSLLPGLDPGFY